MTGCPGDSGSWPCLHQESDSLRCFLLMLVFPGLRPLACVVVVALADHSGGSWAIHAFFSPVCSGWRPDLTDRCVPFAKLASAETRSSPSMEGAALGNRTPERRPLLVLKDRGQSRRIEGITVNKSVCSTGKHYSQSTHECLLFVISY
ncbi:hypothetical protein H8959_004661 [Pygathrix nigripes]